MLDGRGNTNGLLVVGGAVAALLAFTLLLYIRGGSGPRTLLTGAAPTQAVAEAPSTPRPAASASGSLSAAQPTTGTSAAPSTVTRTPIPTAAVAGATSRPSPTPTRTPRPTVTPSPTPTPTPTATGYQLPNSPQKAVVALANGQGGCANFPAGGVVGETSFSQTASGRLTATSPSNHPLSGRVQANGSFTLSGTNPVERWIGTLTDTGGTGSYFIVINGCTEGYETTIAFHP